MVPRGKKKIKKKIFQNSLRGAPSVSRIRSGLFGACKWTPGVKKKFFNIFSGGPGIRGIRSVYLVHSGGPSVLNKIINNSGASSVSGIRSVLFGAFRWSPGVTKINLTGGPRGSGKI